jgi:hypothetical protein
MTDFTTAVATFVVIDLSMSAARLAFFLAAVAPFVVRLLNLEFLVHSQPLFRRRRRGAVGSIITRRVY